MKGKKIGKFLIEKEIGSGGIGNVYLGNRIDDQVQQKVAIKVLKNRFNCSGLKCFEAEKALLIYLDCSGIPRLIDEGVTEQGLHYYVMEYVEGKLINEYCQYNQLTVKQRLQLFKEVCKIVSHAHSKLIIHRDLKPQNILVTNNAKIKLLDFGISQSLQYIQTSKEKAVINPYDFVMTPQYAAPEHFCGNAEGIPSDVYQLGLVLYELLTVSPTHEIANLSIAQIEKVITEKIPLNASKKVVEKKIDVTSFKLKRNKQLEEILKGDLDTILNKALKKEPQKRYQNVYDFSNDIDNYLNFKPVSVRNDQKLYRLKKYLFRNWLLIFAIIGLTLTMSLSIYFINQERNNALKEKRSAEDVSNFLVSIFQSADGTKTQGENVIAEKILDAGVRQINNYPDSKIKNRLLLTMGEVYYELAEYEKALELIEQITGEKNQSIPLKAKMLNFKGKYNQALNLIEQFSYVKNSEEELKYLNTKSKILREADEMKLALSAGKEMVAKALLLYGENSIKYANYLTEYTSILIHYPSQNESINNYIKAINIFKKNDEYMNPKLALTYRRLGYEYLKIESLDKAMEATKMAERIYKDIYGEHHLVMSVNLNQRGLILMSLDEFDQAIDCFKLAIKIRENTLLSKTHHKLSSIYFNIGLVYIVEGKNFDQAIEFINEAISLISNNKEKYNNSYYHFHKYLSFSLIKTKQYAQAKNILMMLLDYYESQNYLTAKYLAECRVLLSMIYFETGEINQSKMLFNSVIEVLRNNSHPDHEIRIEAEILHEKLSHYN